jgi:hypothetical protein
MALKTPLKLAKKKPRRVFAPFPAVNPISTASPRAPTGNVERWLVTHRGTGGVLGVVWNHYWFGARARAEWVHKMPRDDLVLQHMPLLPVEQDTPHPMSGLQLATALGKKMHEEAAQ